MVTVFVGIDGVQEEECGREINVVGAFSQRFTVDQTKSNLEKSKKAGFSFSSNNQLFNEQAHCRARREHLSWVRGSAWPEPFARVKHKEIARWGLCNGQWRRRCAYTRDWMANGWEFERVFGSASSDCLDRSIPKTLEGKRDDSGSSWSVAFLPFSDLEIRKQRSSSRWNSKKVQHWLVFRHWAPLDEHNVSQYWHAHWHWF